MKKFKSLFAVLAFGGLILSGCFGKKESTEPETPSGGGSDPEDTVLVDNTYESFNVFGNNKVVSGGEEVDNDWAVKEFNGMTAISLKQAKTINESLYNTLKTKSIKGLYKFEGLVLGTKDAGWTTDYMDGAAKKSINGSYCFKACGCDKNEDDEWVKTCHFPSAESHGESLTPSTLFVTENMSADAVDGFDHNSNPVALEAGVYTVVLATYKSAVGAMGLMCGVGLVKTGDKEGYVEPETYPVTSIDVAGAFEGWGTNPVVLTKTGNSFDGEITLAEAGEFKVRLNGAWTYSLGSGALADGQYHDNDTNISKAAGKWAVHVELAAAAIADFNTNQTIVSFTVSAVA